MPHYTVISADIVYDGFDVVLDRCFDDSDPGESFDSSIYDINDIRRQIDLGHMEWFVLRARATVQGHTLGTAYIGGCLYQADSVKDVLTDGIGEDCVADAVQQAKQNVSRLLPRLTQLAAQAEQL